jgi:mRNA interferase HigB
VKLAGEERTAAFASKHKDLKNALKRWVETVEAADWKNPVDMKKTFGSADIVGAQTVFNVGGNKCRLIALVQYKSRRVLVQHVLTHTEYDKGDWKE